MVDCGNNTGGYIGWRDEPRSSMLAIKSDGLLFRAGDVGIVIAVRNVARNFAAKQWHYILVSGKGLVWFPMGWTWTLDYAYAEGHLSSNGTVGYDGV